VQLPLVRHRRSHRLPAVASAVKFANVHLVIKPVATNRAAMRRPGKKLVHVKAAAHDDAALALPADASRVGTSARGGEIYFE